MERVGTDYFIYEKKWRVGYLRCFEIIFILGVIEQLYIGLKKFLRGWDLCFHKWYLNKEGHNF